MSIDTVCQACLSTDRNLYSLSQFYNLLKELRIFQKPSEKRICWECKAKLKNMKLFIDKVKYAQSILGQFPGNNVQNLASLSMLSIVKVGIESCYNDENYETFTKNVEIKEEINDESLYKHETSDDYINHGIDDGDYPIIDAHENLYKHETGNNDIDHGIDDGDYPMIDAHFKVEGMKTEVSHKYLPTNKKIKANVKFSKSKIKSNTCRPVLKKIETHKLMFWMERERNSEFYKTSVFNCLHCFKSFPGLKQFKQHMDVDHKPSEFMCDVCKVGFDTKDHLQRHIPKHYFIRECPVCQYQCYGRSNMRYHLRRHIASQKYRCDQCTQTFSLVTEFKRHYTALHKRCVCDECGKSVTTKLMMEKHFKNHHTTIPCKECNTTYKNKKNYNAHFNLRHVKYPAEVQELCYCVQCDLRFDNQVLYRRHLQSSRAHRERKKVPCPECDKVYSRKTFMMNHYRLIHLNKTNFYCKLCDKYLLNSTRFKYHMKYQHQKLEKEKNKLCSICGRGFNTNRTLSNHILTHTGERPYPCDICGARFSQKQAMQSHVKHVHFNVSRRKTDRTIGLNNICN